MPVMLERWNDDKMDALDEKVDGLGHQMLEQRQDMKTGFERINERFDRLQLTILAGVFAAVAALIGFN